MERVVKDVSVSYAVKTIEWVAILCDMDIQLHIKDIYTWFTYIYTHTQKYIQNIERKKTVKQQYYTQQSCLSEMEM